jgi:2-dehydro-3-deoxygluconokinase
MEAIAALGEVMIELAPAPGQLKQLAYAGDTYNTAIYLARLGIPTQYVTRLGSDIYSKEILQQLANEQIGANLIEQDTQRQPGLYMITNTPDGERQFAYWRDQSAARLLFSAADPDESLMNCRYLYLSGITLAIISAEARARLASFISRYRAQGGQLVFDSNYRPRLWPNQAAAQDTIAQFLHLTDMALLTIDDEILLWQDADQAAVLDRLATYNLTELVIKRGAEPALVLTADNKRAVAVAKIDNVVDTTAAGDSFNAGYLAARYLGKTPEEAVALGAACAGAVIQHRGAILPKPVFLTLLKDVQDQVAETR